MGSERTIKKSVSKYDALGWIHQASCFLCSSEPGLGTFVSPVTRAGSEAREKRGRNVQREQSGQYHQRKFGIIHVFNVIIQI